MGPIQSIIYGRWMSAAEKPGKAAIRPPALRCLGGQRQVPALIALENQPMEKSGPIEATSPSFTAWCDALQLADLAVQIADDFLRIAGRRRLVTARKQLIRSLDQLLLPGADHRRMNTELRRQFRQGLFSSDSAAIATAP
jgi:hypothetical protein